MTNERLYTMDAIGYKHLPIHLEEIAYQSAWSIQNMDGHGCSSQEIIYKGSLEKENGQITDFFQDINGSWWYDKRFRNERGEIISMEEKIFGRRLVERKKPWNKPGIEGKMRNYYNFQHNHSQIESEDANE